MTTESDNIKEEIKEITEKCIRCGLCRTSCSVLRIMREECYSPRGKLVMLDNDLIEKIIYECNLCKACVIQCPLNLKICDSFINARKILINQKKEIPELKEIIKNIDNTGNIFGIKDK